LILPESAECGQAAVEQDGRTMNKIFYAFSAMSPVEWAVLTAAAVMFHAIWIVSALRTNRLAFLTAASSVLYPLALSVTMPGYVALRVARFYVLCLLLTVGIFSIRPRAINSMLLAAFAFCLYYTFGALWSDFPAEGLAYKAGSFLTTVTAGMLLATSLSHLDELAALNRFMVVAGFALLFVLVPDFGNMMQADADRWQPWGINPNGLGRNAAALLPFTYAAALFDPTKKWRLWAIGSSTACGAIVILTGSRAAFLGAAAAIFFGTLPLLRKPAHLLALVTGIVLFLSPLFFFFQFDTVERLGDYKSTNRTNVWERAFYEYQKAPILGNGWYYTFDRFGDTRTTNAHSSYIQILVELGLVGACAFLLLVIRLIVSVRGAFAHTVGHMAGRRLVWIATGWIVGYALISGFENNLDILFPTLTVGFCIAVIGRLENSEDPLLVTAGVGTEHWRMGDSYAPALSS
jgi:O-antigen ligase